MKNFVYDGKFEGNILLMGRTDCIKATFVQKVAVNIFFGKKSRESVVDDTDSVCCCRNCIQTK